MREQIASVDTRLVELHGRLLGAHRSQDWLAAYDVALQCQELLGEPQLFLPVWERLLTMLAEGAADEQIWKQIQDTMETRRRLTETEGKTQERLHQTFTVENAMAFTHAISSLCREFVPAERLVEFVQRLRQMTLGAAETPRER